MSLINFVDVDTAYNQTEDIYKLIQNDGNSSNSTPEPTASGTPAILTSVTPPKPEESFGDKLGAKIESKVEDKIKGDVKRLGVTTATTIWKNAQEPEFGNNDDIDMAA